MQHCSCLCLCCTNWYCQYLSMALHDGVMVNWRECGRKWSWLLLRHHPGIQLESVKKMTEYLCQNSQCLSQNWSWIQVRSITAWATSFAHAGLVLHYRNSGWHWDRKYHPSWPELFSVPGCISPCWVLQEVGWSWKIWVLQSCGRGMEGSSDSCTLEWKHWNLARLWYSK